MKVLYRIVAAILAFCIINSCSVLSKVAGSGNGNQNGLATGLALLGLYKAIKGANTGSTAPVNANNLDLSNTNNLLNLGQLLTGASTLQNATPNYTSQFSNGLISGSSNLVNQNNVSSIISSLLGLNNINNSALLAAAQTPQTKSATTTTPAVTTQTTGVSETLSALTGILGLLK